MYSTVQDINCSVYPRVRLQLGQGSDENWSRKIYSNFIERNTHPRFAKPRFSNTAFIIHHFADHVEYSALGFLQKNRDSIFEEQVLLLRDSKACPLLRCTAVYSC